MLGIADIPVNMVIALVGMYLTFSDVGSQFLGWHIIFGVAKEMACHRLWFNGYWGHCSRSVREDVVSGQIEIF